MTNYANDEKLGQVPIQFLTPTSMRIDVPIHLLEIIIKVGRYFPIIFLSLASLNLLLAANDFLANSLVFAILNLMFALGDFIFLVQMRQRRKNHVNECTSSYNNPNKTISLGNGE